MFIILYPVGVAGQILLMENVIKNYFSNTLFQ